MVALFLFVNAGHLKGGRALIEPRLGAKEHDGSLAVVGTEAHLHKSKVGPQDPLRPRGTVQERESSVDALGVHRDATRFELRRGRENLARRLESLGGDGIDELLVCFASRGGVPGPARRLLVRTTDTGDEWLAEVGTGITARRVTGEGEEGGDGGVDCVVAGTASELYLLLWNRLPDGGSITVSGDPELLRSWQDQVQVRWA